MSIRTRLRRWNAVCLLSTSAIVVPFAAGTAHAEDAADVAAAPAPDAAAPSGGIGEIVVTATRKSESVQKVPISMQALSNDALEVHQVKGLSDITAMLPSVTIAGLGPGRQTPYFRGIVPAGGSYASVGYYLDDIPIAGTDLPDIHVYDIERVEALSGPQGTLYGAGSLAGTIRFITNKPKLDTFEYGYNTEINKYGAGDVGQQFEAYVNVPIASNLAARAMGYYRHDGGYIDNKANTSGVLNTGASSTLLLGDNNDATSYTLDNSSIAKDNYNPIYEYGGRLEVLWEPAPGWEVRPEITAQRQIAYGYFGYDPRVGDLEVHDYDLTRQDDQWYQAQLSIHGHIGDWDLVSATGYYHRKVHLRNDYTYYTVTYDSFGAGYENYLQFWNASSCTGTGSSESCSSLISPQQYYEGLTKDNQFTQEVRLTTPSSWPFDVTIGGYYQHRKEETNDQYAIHGLSSVEGYTESGGGDVAGGLLGVPAMYAVAYDDDGNAYFDTSTVINADGNPNGTMILGSPAVKGDAYYLSERNNVWNDEAIFAEGHYNITPKLKLTGGIRVFWTSYHSIGFSGVAASAEAVGCTVPFPSTRLSCINANGRYSESGETHKIALDWQVQPDKMIYATYSTGFRPGGYNRSLRVSGVGTVTVQPYESETLSNYEIGIKTIWSNIFRFNAAMYYETWDNMQYSVVVAGTQGAGMTGNAGKAVVKGIEYDAELKLGKVTFTSSGAFNDGKLKGNFCNFALDETTMSISQLSSCSAGTYVDGNVSTPSVAAADGTRLPRQPRFKGTTSVRYDTQVGDMDGYLMGSANYQTSATQDLNTDYNELLGTTPGFTSFDFSAGLKKGTWTLDFFIQNAFDKRGQLTKNTFCSITFCSSSSRTFTIKPRFFGVRWGQAF
ncbi:TonB-dependent receptor [Novosphingobium sp. 1949]|uniref:TonB-dependent receptor n=1 Tax=Novosphingobium organovorum TaxID=2930092 RepID=A0ABT0BFG5_9SPHN|nr:TonB-dependent receptor [Novosphingobium organovorum]MCJ2183793.1 TonB-dependent receptor [Novosphingobium organovorum]